ncbi:hypothetical protein ACGFK1_11665 [Mycobacterium sp. NPDC048908]|uniref:hypothetical protein n=1 Tax=Mycobacterium sp. NPDC048908 TaxID=3364292 RepID=UPI0037105BC5
MGTKFEFDFMTTASPEQVIALMTDFSPDRVHRWPASSAKAFEVYHVGDTDADIREGQDFPKVWASWHYDWSKRGSVTLTVTESDTLTPGGYMRLTATPRDEGGSAVHGEWEQSPKSLTAAIGVYVMRFIGPRFLAAYYKKVYDSL